MPAIKKKNGTHPPIPQIPRIVSLNPSRDLPSTNARGQDDVSSPQVMMYGKNLQTARSRKPNNPVVDFLAIHYVYYVGAYFLVLISLSLVQMLIHQAQRHNK
jgi:hypothetical protein